MPRSRTGRARRIRHYHEAPRVEDVELALQPPSASSEERASQAVSGPARQVVQCGAAPADNCGETVNSLNFASRAKTVALGKATKNREDANLGEGGSKSGKASTVMAAANKLGNDADGAAAGAPSAEPVKASARGEAGAKKTLGAKKR